MIGTPNLVTKHSLYVYANLFNFVGLSSAEISFLLGTLPLVGLFTAPALGVLADRCGARKCGGGDCCAPSCGAQRSLLSACLILAIVGTQGLGLMTPRPKISIPGNLTGIDANKSENNDIENDYDLQNNDCNFLNNDINFSAVHM